MLGPATGSLRQLSAGFGAPVCPAPIPSRAPTRISLLPHPNAFHGRDTAVTHWPIGRVEGWRFRSIQYGSGARPPHLSAQTRPLSSRACGCRSSVAATGPLTGQRRHCGRLSASSASGPRSSDLPFSQETARALRAAKDQAVRQGLMFAGPDQLLLGILASAERSDPPPSTPPSTRGDGAGGSSGSSAALLLQTALGGGDVDSVREWLNEQTGAVVPIMYGAAGQRGSADVVGFGGGGGGGSSRDVSSSWLRPSDVEFTAAAREVMRRAAAGAEAMGSRSVGSYHLLMVLMGTEGERDSATERVGEGEGEGSLASGSGAVAVAVESSSAAPSLVLRWTPQPRPEGETAPDVAAAEEGGLAAGHGDGNVQTAASGGGNTTINSNSSNNRICGLLPVLLRAVGADTASLHNQLLALAEADGESPQLPDAAVAAYRDAVEHLRETYRRQVSLPYYERDDAAFRRASISLAEMASKRGKGVQATEEEDPYE
ncbi:hypothetical protein VaNZ11_007484 [Volvox africanus]|uniref:Clp R domain-containing protein n=1 Tax=Volvox africanus TaxID=51714 RepID=A0ABQ5S3T6_9CHLO|nr:hypothetical protein VaNZ11_007484 [Volvox africanus]